MGWGSFKSQLIITVSTNNNGFLHEEKAIKRIDLQRVASVSKNKGITIEQYIKGNHLVMTLKKFIPIKELIFDLNLTLENNIYILWEMSFNFPNYNRPGWSGFMQVYRKGALPRKSEVTLLPIISLNPIITVVSIQHYYLLLASQRKQIQVHHALLLTNRCGLKL